MSDSHVDRLQDLKARLEAIPAADRKRIGAWVAEAIAVVSHDWPSFIEEFRRVVAEPHWATVDFLPGGSIEEVAAYAGRETRRLQPVNARIADDAKLRIVGTLKGILATASREVSVPEVSAKATVVNLCRKFPVFARNLAKRQRKRPSVDVVDEYDVQYLFLALLRLHFEVVIAEEWVPSYAGSTSRMDFLLKQEKVVIETKMTRQGLRDGEVGEQLIVDIEKYAQHLDCATLICYVYDPQHLLESPRALELDLSHPRGKMDVQVVVSPSSF